jgi:DnaK suppressor protein
MQDSQRREIKARILEELASLRDIVADLEAGVAPVAPDQALGRLSRLDSMLNQGVNEASLARSKGRIVQLEATLRRLDDDPDFGECAECGALIPLARLLAVPESGLCVRCAS